MHWGAPSQRVPCLLDPFRDDRVAVRLREIGWWHAPVDGGRRELHTFAIDSATTPLIVSCKRLQYRAANRCSGGESGGERDEGPS